MNLVSKTKDHFGSCFGSLIGSLGHAREELFCFKSRPMFLKTDNIGNLNDT